MALVTSVDEQTIDVDINNGREPPAIKRQRTKAKGALWKKISEATNGSSTHRRLLVATKRTKACFSLRDFDHQVARKACARFDKPITSEGTAPLRCILHSISSLQPAEFQEIIREACRAENLGLLSNPPARLLRLLELVA